MIASLHKEVYLGRGVGIGDEVGDAQGDRTQKAKEYVQASISS